MTFLHGSGGLTKSLGSIVFTEPTNRVSDLAHIGGYPESRDFTGSAFRPVIASDARIEAFVTVDAGTRRPTTIGAAFLMKHSHVGHDAIIEDGCELAPGTIVGGFAWLRKNVHVGMNATIRNRVTVGEGARIGMGAVVTKDVPAGETWVGNPARNIQTDSRIDPLWDEWWASRG